MELYMYNRKPKSLFYGVEEHREESIYKTLLDVFILLGVDQEKAKGIQLVITPTGFPVATHVLRTLMPLPQASAHLLYSDHRKSLLGLADRDLILSTFENLKRPPRAAERLVQNQSVL